MILILKRNFWCFATAWARRRERPIQAIKGTAALCVETHHIGAVMSAQRNITDSADALGLAHIVHKKQISS
jgi:hypothetical protein